jgi:16S rRNA (guanine527-N7)-methyltransferase
LTTSGQGDLAADKERALALTPVSRETKSRLEKFVDELLLWQTKMNLVASSQLPILWTRHIADSLQLLKIADSALQQTPFIPAQAGIQSATSDAGTPGPGSPLAPGRTENAAKVWVDFGSGAGFPGIPIACALAETPGAKVHLVESVGKKANFLREVVSQLGLPAVVHQERAEKFGDSFTENVDVVTARALAPLKVLCDQAFPLIAKGAVGLFPKGQDIAAELTEAAKYWRLETSTVPSVTSTDGAIVIVRHIALR